jgi:hypothetical protein
MSNPKNLHGVRFGRLIATTKMPSRVTPSGYTLAVWLCECDCGNSKAILARSLISGATISCGCYIKSIRGDSIRTHGMSRTSFYRAWRSMLNRCDYKECYVSRGIKVCDRWRVFDKFMEDMIKGYSNELSLDRINNDGDYTPQNCRWATKKEQTRNRRITRTLTVFCETKPMAEWCDIYGVSYSTLNSRINCGWPSEKALLTKVESHG